MLDCPLPLTGGADRRRAGPAHPIIRTAVYSPDDAFRYTHSRVWGPRAKLLWVTYHPHDSDTLTASRLINRLTRWSYRAGYDGFIVVSLYPLLASSLNAVRQWRTDSHAQPEAAICAAADYARLAVRQWQCHDAVMATGPLDATEAQDLELWLTTLQGGAGRGRPMIRRWWCLGLTERSWPLAPARAGAKAVTDEAPLIRWQFPTQPVAPLRSPAKGQIASPKS